MNKAKRSSVRGSWQPDSSARACMLCETKFSLLTRRHHCRICGLVFCAKCAPHRLRIEHSASGMSVRTVSVEHGVRDRALTAAATLSASVAPAASEQRLQRTCHACLVRHVQRCCVDARAACAQLASTSLHYSAEAFATDYSIARGAQAEPDGTRVWLSVALRRAQFPSRSHSRGCFVALLRWPLGPEPDDLAAAELGRTEVRPCASGAANFAVLVEFTLGAGQGARELGVAVCWASADDLRPLAHEDLAATPVALVFGADRPLVRSAVFSCDVLLLGGAGDAGAAVLFEVESVENCQTREAMRTAERRYRFATQHGTVLVSETLEVSPFSFEVPRLVLGLLVERRLATLDALLVELGRGLQQVSETRRSAAFPLALGQRAVHLATETSELLDGLLSCTLSELRRLGFKASTEKSNAALQYIPTNLAVQQIRVARREGAPADDDQAPFDVVFPIITVGAFAAHALGFKTGGLRQLMASAERGGGSPGQSRSDSDGEDDMSSDGEAAADLAARIEVVFCQALAATVASFVSTVNGVVHSHDGVATCAFLEGLVSRGFVCQVESLLSTQGKEAGMIGDLDAAMRSLESVRFCLRLLETAPSDVAAAPSPADELAQDSCQAGDDANARGRSSSAPASKRRAGSGVRLVVRKLSHSPPPLGGGAVDIAELLASLGSSDVGGHGAASSDGEQLAPAPAAETMQAADALLTDVLAALPVGILEQSLTIECRGESFASSDMVFVVGFTLALSADMFPPSLAQAHEIVVVPLLFNQGINEMQTVSNVLRTASLQAKINSESLVRLRNVYEHWLAWSNPTLDDAAFAAERLAELEADLALAAPRKNHAILANASDLVRTMHGGRITVCKSAKDRTAMSCTHEQARLLHRLYGTCAGPDDMAALFRARGVRRENAFSNVGMRRYAFNVLQRLMLPSHLRPPTGSTASLQT